MTDPFSEPMTAPARSSVDGVPILDVLDGAAHAQGMLEQFAGDLPEFIYVDHEGMSPQDHNLLIAARQDPRARLVLNVLVLAGYYVWSVAGQRTKVIHHDALVRHWPELLDGTYEWAESGIAYSYSPAATTPESLVVMFTAGAPNLFASSVSARHFTQFSPGFQRYLPAHTGVLRMSDLGGPVGSFYMATSTRPHGFAAVDDLIRETATSHGIPDDRIILCGPSKGGTGAVAHALANDWAFVAADPILEDDYYAKFYNITPPGLYLERKQDVFARLIAEARNPRGVVITAEASPQFRVVTETMAPLTDRVTVFNSRNPAITSHPTVGPETINLQAMSINLLANGFAPPPGQYDVM